ncbi:MAG: PglL family O-oligosaccharyltransferase [Burkholderiaceae bacterium]
MRIAAVALLVLLPWLNPFVGGPSAAVTPLLVSWTCAVLLLALWRTGDWQAAALAWLAAGLLSSAIAGLQFFDLEAALAPWLNQTDPGTAFANLRQRNLFATLTNIAQAALLFGLMSQPLGRAAHGLGLLAAALLAVGTALSASRTGLLQLVLLLALALLWQWSARRSASAGMPVAEPRTPPAVLTGGVLASWAAVVLLAYAAAASFLPSLAGVDPAEYGIFARLTQELGCSSRRVLWANVLELVAQRPWLGWGWGELDYAHYLHLYRDTRPEQRFCAIVDNAHNLPLHLAVEFGVPLALLLCGGALWWLIRQKPWAEQGPVRQMAWGVLALVGVHSLLEFPLWYGPFQIAVGLALALLLQKPPKAVFAANFESKPLVAKVKHAGIALFLIVPGLAGLGYAAWDYWRIGQIYKPAAERSAAYQGDTLGKLQASWLFSGHVRFAELGLTTLRPSNAPQVYALASEMLHFSPEPKVVEKLIESAAMLGRDAEAAYHLARYRAAFPQEYDAWRAKAK